MLGRAACTACRRERERERVSRRFGKAPIDTHYP